MTQDTQPNNHTDSQKWWEVWSKPKEEEPAQEERKAKNWFEVIFIQSDDDELDEEQ